jgi:diguanylate cyclase (GGDEF)-like protein/PAS domain S-box-containing protein
MNPAAFRILSSPDAKQALRLRRFGVAALSYVLAMALVALAWGFGVLPASTVLEAAAAFLALNLGLYAVIRSGFNLRFADPSLTRIQMLAAITVLMYIVYHMDHGREVALFGCFVVFLFGIFRLTVREFAFVTLYTLAAYALVIILLTRWRPQAIHDLSLDWMGWLGLAGLLPCFNIIGGQINALRGRMRASEARFRSLTEMSSDFYWESDAGHRLTHRGSAARKVSSVSVFRQGAQIGERRWEIPHLSPDEAGWQAHRAVLDAHQPFRDFELSRLGADGTQRFISISGDPVLDASGAFMGYRGVGTDVTARKRAAQALRDAAEELRLFAENVPVMTIALDANLRCIFANKAYAEFFGQSATQIAGRHLSEIVGQEAYREIEGHLARALQGRTVTYQRVRRLDNGESRHIEVKLVPHTGDQGRVAGCFAVTTDITEHKLTEERIRRVAHHDSLTGLPNRLLFNDRLAQAISLARRDSRSFALLYLDLNRFKPVNDVLGHAAGDEVLKEVATRIRQQVRDSDTVARIGGDEFAVVLPDVAGRRDAESVARKIRAALAAPFRLGEGIGDAEIGASIGIALYPADGEDADALVGAADAAMYRTKQACGTASASRAAGIAPATA